MSKRANRASRMWWGTRDRMQWVACPNPSMPSSKVGWSTSANYLNGGAYVRSSTTAHREYELTWDTVSLEDARQILDYADRLYGDGPFYWIDPTAADVNVLPQWFASPFQGLDDGPILNGRVTRGESVATPANNLGYPTRSIRYDVNASTDTPIQVWVPIPPGYTAWVGAHGQDGTGGTLTVTPTTGPAPGTPVDLTLLGVTDTTRFNETFTGVDGILLGLSGTGTVTLSGVMVQILKDGKTPEIGGFLSGQGHSGCSFASQPEYVPYSAAFGTGSVVASLIETEGWR